jgi:hypothetical protein
MTTDWADDIATEILTECRKYGHVKDFGLMISLRLRQVREQGYSAGFRDGMDTYERATERAFAATQPARTRFSVENVIPFDGGRP